MLSIVRFGGVLPILRMRCPQMTAHLAKRSSSQIYEAVHVEAFSAGKA